MNPPTASEQKQILMAILTEYESQYRPTPPAAVERVKISLPEKGPSASQVLAVLTLLPLIGVILTCTVIGLAVATPLFVFFSPVLVPAMVAIGLAVTGFLAWGAMGLTVLLALSRMLNNGRGRRRMVEAAGSVGQLAKDVGQEIQEKARDVKP